LSKYQLHLARSAEKDIRHLPKTDQQRLAVAIRALAGVPRPQGCQKMVDSDGYRSRVGVYRIVYDIDDKGRKVNIYRVKHRKDIYR